MSNISKKYTVLLLSAPIGSGHRLAAEALREVLSQKENVEVVHGNVFDFFPHFLGTAFLRTYLWILGCCPWLYELAYKWGNSQGGSLWLRGLINHTLAMLGSGYLRRINPDAVIATHATPAGIMSYYKKKHPELYLAGVITDFTVHKWWLVNGVDAYFLADERLKDRITVPSEVHAYGIPVRQDFKHNAYAVCREKYGWSAEEKVCLLMGGGEGLLPMEEMLHALTAAHIPGLRLVAITGHNEKLAQQLRQSFSKNLRNLGESSASCANPLEIYGFRQDIPQMLAGADMIITKAGGLTCAEVLASGLDLFIYKPLPGQEQGNAAFLEAHYGAKICHNLEKLAAAVANKASQKEFSKDTKALGNPLAAEQICAFVLEKLARK
ncbi:MAG: glycosyltransferase [Phascolarctobacterium sp.]